MTVIVINTDDLATAKTLDEAYRAVVSVDLLEAPATPRPFRMMAALQALAEESS